MGKKELVLPHLALSVLQTSGKGSEGEEGSAEASSSSLPMSMSRSAVFYRVTGYCGSGSGFNLLPGQQEQVKQAAVMAVRAWMSSETSPQKLGGYCFPESPLVKKKQLLH